MKDEEFILTLGMVLAMLMCLGSVCAISLKAFGVF